MASTGMRVATIGTLWMVLTREARSSVSSYSLKSSKGLIFYIRFDLIIIFKILINNRKKNYPLNLIGTLPYLRKINDGILVRFLI